ncbi:MAG TPA: NAD(P)H-dependent glycerol-3-phosphate dehydrogenase [Syntrophomonadaceae bacterium]|nr:NAD(P)H-dependent glycerol-3-phosphate dehydrogenase [Syntrophomonadaceae bacterium]
MQKICILGAGSWGTAQATLLSRNAARVDLWGRPEDGIDSLKNNRENQRFLPGVKLADNIIPGTDLEEALRDAEIVVLAVPSQTLRSVSALIKPVLPENAIVVNTAKGLEIDSGMRLSQVIQEVLGEQIRSRFAVLSGPSHAEEVAREVPTAVTVAAFQDTTAFQIQDAYMSPVFRVYTNPDMAGVELGGALKNIIALASGIVDGLGYGDNTKAALLTRGLTEIIRLGEAMGGNPRTFSGLSGLGDLVVTCSSRYSRNRQAGELIGQGFTLDEALQEVGMVVEGAYTTRVAYQLANIMKVDMPIITACYRTLYEDRPAHEGIKILMTRRKKHEIEEIAEN